MKPQTNITVVTLMIFLFSLFAVQANLFAATTFRFAHVTSDPHPWFLAAEEFKKLIEERCKGEVLIKIFPSGQLGNINKETEGVRLGSIDLTLIGTGVQGPSYVKESAVPSLPYMFKDKATAYKVLDGPIGDEIAALFEKKGFIHLGYWEVGLRHVTNNKRPINSIEDVAGLKIRVQEGKHWEYLMKAWKAIPVYITWTELFSALQQGVADGQENPITSIYASKAFEVQKYIALTGHTYDAASLLMNPRSFKKLNPAQQKLFRDTAKEVGIWQRALISKAEKKYMKVMQDKGIVITQPDVASFMKVSQGIYDDLKELYPAAFIEKVQAAAKAAQ